MTGPQKGHLYYLGQENGVRIPFVDNRVCDNTQKVTKAEASLLISMFEHGVRPTDAHIDSLGRSMTPVCTSLNCSPRPIPVLKLGCQYDPPSHPSQWMDPFAPANAVQLDWLTELMSIPHEVTAQTLEGLTNGHASLLIERLKWYKDRCWMGYRDVKGMMVLL